MGKKKEKSGFLPVLLLITGLFIFLLILYLLYERGHQPISTKLPVETIPRDSREAMLQLERLRKRKDFAWPVNLLKEELKLVEHTAFSLGYSETHEQSAWVAYVLSNRHAENLYDRRNNFRADPAISSSSASPGDYSHSGFDRGHLAPAADFDYSNKTLSESFYMSNMSPQLPAFNRGGWKELEEQLREWAIREDSLWVVTGPVLSSGLKKIGTNGISVPEYFYKIILDARQPEIKMISFLMPNKKISRELRYWVVSVDSVERLSGLDFFPQLPDLLEDSLESSRQTGYWFLNSKK